MNRNQAFKVLKYWAKQGISVFTKQDLAKLFPEDNTRTFSESLRRLVKAGYIKRVCHSIYMYEEAIVKDGYILERIAVVLRRGEYSYVSLESRLSEYGVISQIPLDRLTVMTTGRKGTYHTDFGVIEFTHTKRDVLDILGSTQYAPSRALRVATKQAAWRDLKRVGRNLHLVDESQLEDD